MWYKRIILAAIDDALKALKAKGVTEPLIQFIDSLPNNKKGKAIGALRQNPFMAINDLEGLLESKYRPSIQELELVDNYDPRFKRWALYQYKLLRSKKLTDNPEDDRWEYKIPITGYAGIKHDLDQVHNFFRSHILDNPNYNIYSKSFDEAWEDSEKWLDNENEKGFYYLPYQRNIFGEIIDDRVLHIFDDNSMIVNVNNINDLVVEAKRMHNCVADHIKQVENGYYKIYSLRNQFNKPEVTFKVSNYGEVSDIKGPNNDPNITDEQNEKIKQFVTRHELEFG